MTASECESDDEGMFHHDKAVPASTTKLSLQFAINKVSLQCTAHDSVKPITSHYSCPLYFLYSLQIGILFSEHHESSGRDTPRLHLMVTSMTSGLLMRSWDMQVTASVGNLHIADHYITGMCY